MHTKTCTPKSWLLLLLLHTAVQLSNTSLFLWSSKWDESVRDHRCASQTLTHGLLRKQAKVLGEVSPPSLSQTPGVPGEEVEDLLLAAGDGGQSFHDGAGGLPCSLCGWSEEHLQDK